MISEEELINIENIWKNTSPGPWKAFIEGRDHDSGSDFIMTGPEGSRGEDLEIYGGRKDDYDFIANAKQDIPRLIAEIRRLRRLIEELDSTLR